MRYLLSSFFAILAIYSHAQKTVIGYYPNYQFYDRNKLVRPDSVKFEKYTFVNYGFFKPQASGNIIQTDPFADKTCLLGPVTNWNPAGYTPGTYGSAADTIGLGVIAAHDTAYKMSRLAHNKGCKLLLSVGGYTSAGLPDNFPVVAASAAARSNFASKCAEIIELYDLDGIDIDWEFPSNNTDKANFTALLAATRDSLDALEPVIGRQLYLTVAVSASPDYMQFIDWTGIISLVDYINLMSYDFYGPWDIKTNHNSPLFPTTNATAGNVTGLSWNEAVNTLLNTYNVPASRLNIGIPFYGRSRFTTGAPGLGVTAVQNVMDTVRFAADAGRPLYYNIEGYLPSYTKHWDTAANVPYLTSSRNNTFVSYDDEQSVGLKAKFINSKDLAGAIVWDLTGDYIGGSNNIVKTPLIDTINAVFGNADDTLLSNTTQAATHEKVTVGYFPNYRMYTRSGAVTKSTIRYESYSIIAYSFLEPRADGKIYKTDPNADLQNLLGNIIWWPDPPAGYTTSYAIDADDAQYHTPNTSMVYYAHARGAKVVVSIGGAGLSAHFSAIAASSSLRTVFAHYCCEVIRKYNVDGLDIDWEFPETMSDKSNYNLLLAQVRDSLDALEPVAGHALELSIAAGVGDHRMVYIDWPVIKNDINYINLMAYDCYGAWDACENHNAPLYPNQTKSCTQVSFSCHEAISTLHNIYDVPYSQINMGIPFYGRSMIAQNQPDPNFAADAGTPLFYNILPRIADGTYIHHWDTLSKVPYLTGNGFTSFVSYDDTAAVRIKSKYINTYGLSGTILWDMTGDNIVNGSNQIVSTPLIDIINEVFASGDSFTDADIPPFTTTWSGLRGNTDSSFSNAANWQCGVIPEYNSRAAVPSGLIYYPVVNEPCKIATLSLAANARTQLNTNLQLTDSLVNNGAIAGSQAVQLTGTDAQTISGNGTVTNLELDNSNGATILPGSMLSVTNEYRPTDGTLTTNGGLVLASNSSNTARISAGAAAGNYIDGNVVIQRYFPARKAWRLITAPVAPSSAPTVHSAWQEGASSGTANPAPGFGMHITGNGANSSVNGLDASSGTSLYGLSGVTGTAITNTRSTKVSDYKAFMIYVRGDRSFDINNAAGADKKETIIRTTGEPLQGDNIEIASVAPGALTIAYNPYLCPIDFEAIHASNSAVIANRLKVWDPSIGGTNGLGAYVTLDWDNGSNTYVSVPTSSLTTQLQSCQAFYIEGTSTGNVLVHESHKSSGTSYNTPFGKSTAVYASLQANMKIVDSGGKAAITDGIRCVYNTDFPDTVDGKDVIKFNNIRENIGVLHSSGKILTIERRSMPEPGDTVHLKLWNMQEGKYHLEIFTGSFELTGMQPYLYDKYTGAFTFLKITDTTNVSFTINADMASKVLDRFSIIYQVASTSSASGKNRKEKNITVYPNPVDGERLNILLQYIPQGSCHYVIMDMAGREIQTGTVKNDNNSACTVTLKNTLPSGNYLLKLNDGTQVFNAKFIINNTE